MQKALSSSIGAIGLATLLACGAATPPSMPPVEPTPAPPPAVASAAPVASSETAKPEPAKPETAEAAPTSNGGLLEKLLNVQRAGAPVALSSTDFLFLSDAPGTPQIFRQASAAPGKDGKLTLGTPQKITDFPDRVAAVHASPDGKIALFLKDTGGDENHQIFRVPTDGGPAVALTNAPKVKHTLPLFDETGARIAFTSNARNGKDMDLYVEELGKGKEGERKPVLELTGMHSVAGLRGDTVLLVEERSNVDQNVLVLDVKTKQIRNLTPHEGQVRYEGASFTADGKGVLALTDAGREFMGAVAIDVASGKASPVVAEAYDLGGLAVLEPKAGTKGDTILFTRNVNGVEEVFVAALDGARKVTKRTATGLKGVVGSASLAPDGKAAFVALESSQSPAEVFRVDVATGKSARATTSDHAGIDEGALVKEQVFTLKTSDAKTISYFVWSKPLPKGAKPERRPAVVVVHGGPEAQAQPNFSPVIQYLVANGYAVAAPNVRGSMGYGKSFAHLDDKEKREDSVRDLSEVGRALAARADVDPKRIALYGGSYGGYMVLAGLTLYPDQWAAGVDIVGIANFRTFLEQTAPYRRANREQEYGALDKDGAFLDKVSPIHKIDRIKAPLMVIHGTRDPRVPIGEARQVADALKKRGVPVELMVFEDEGHGLAKRANRLKAYPKMVDFLGQHLKP